MDADDLCGRYRRLRSELDAAYAAAAWDGERIDRIAGALLQLERALGARRLEMSDVVGARRSLPHAPAACHT